MIEWPILLSVLLGFASVIYNQVQILNTLTEIRQSLMEDIGKRAVQELSSELQYIRLRLGSIDERVQYILKEMPNREPR